MAKGQKKQKKTSETIGKLEYAFAIDATVKEACFYAGIHPDTYYEWIKHDPELSDRLEGLRNTPILAARQTVAKGVKETYANAMDYLKRKRKEEFAERSEVTGKDGESLFGEIKDKYEYNE